MHDRLQAFEISVVPVSLHEGWIGPLVDIAQRRHLHSRLVIRRQLQPSRIHRRGLAEQMPSNEKSDDAAIDKRHALRIGDIAQRVWPVLRKVRMPLIYG